MSLYLVVFVVVDMGMLHWFVFGRLRRSTPVDGQHVPHLPPGGWSGGLNKLDWDSPPPNLGDDNGPHWTMVTPKICQQMDILSVC